MIEADEHQVEGLWSRWLCAHSPADRDSLCEAYTPFVRMLAAKCYARRINHGLEFCDYMQFGMVGLLEAIDRFSPTHGVKFETFAGHRIQGAIINGAESLSEIQKQTAVRRRVVRERSSSLCAADTLGAGESALERLAKVAIGLALGFALEDSGIYASEERTTADTAYTRLEMRQFREQLVQLVHLLPPQEHAVIHRHYFQQIPFDHIAASMGVTKGRVSQVHKAAIARLRALRAQNANFRANL